jgi:hypothetical protein
LLFCLWTKIRGQRRFAEVVIRKDGTVYMYRCDAAMTAGIYEISKITTKDGKHYDLTKMDILGTELRPAE